MLSHRNTSSVLSTSHDARLLVIAILPPLALGPTMADFNSGAIACGKTDLMNKGAFSKLAHPCHSIC